MSAETIKRLADEYAHVYAFVGDDTMPVKRRELHAAIDSLTTAAPAVPAEGAPPKIEFYKDDKWQRLDGHGCKTQAEAADYVARFGNGEYGAPFRVAAANFYASRGAPQPEPPSAEPKEGDPLYVTMGGPHMETQRIYIGRAGAQASPASATLKESEVPEGCTPTDARVLRMANHALAQESHDLQDVVADLYRQIKEFCEKEGEADFYTGKALEILCQLRPHEYSWPFSKPMPERASSPEAALKAAPVAWHRVYVHGDHGKLIEAHWTEESARIDQRKFGGDVSPVYASSLSAPAGWKLLKDTTHDERSWPEDASHENGNYSCLCCECLRMFVGHKRRVVCKVCASPEAHRG